MYGVDNYSKYHGKKFGGIESADQQRLFRLFATLGRSDEHGAGVGLALCRAIAEGHGGRAWLDSQPGRGTAVHLSFPLS